MRLSQRDSVIALVCLGLGMLLSAVFFGTSGGRWQASGNGVTIFNTRTGETRYSDSGESVKEVLERQKAEKAAAEAEAKKAAQETQRRERKYADDRPKRLAKWALEKKNKYGYGPQLIAEMRDMRQSVTAKGVSDISESQLRKLNSWADELEMPDFVAETEEWLLMIKRQRDDIFQRLKTFVEKHPTVMRPASARIRWEPATRPLRIRDFLTEKEKNDLLEVLGMASIGAQGQDRSEFEQAIRLAREYRPREFAAVGLPVTLEEAIDFQDHLGQ